MHRSDFIVALVLMVFGALVAIESWRMPRFENIGGSIANAPGLVPGLLGVVIAAFGAVMAVRAVASASTAPPERPPDPVDEDPVAEGPDAGRARFGWMLGLSLLYAGFLIGRIDFALATFLFVFSSVVAFERPMVRSVRDGVVRIAVAAAIALGVSVAIPYVFERIFLVTLP